MDYKGKLMLSRSGKLTKYLHPQLHGKQKGKPLQKEPIPIIEEFQVVQKLPKQLKKQRPSPAFLTEKRNVKKSYMPTSENPEPNKYSPKYNWVDSQKYSGKYISSSPQHIKISEEEQSECPRLHKAMHRSKSPPQTFNFSKSFHKLSTQSHVNSEEQSPHPLRFTYYPNPDAPITTNKHIAKIDFSKYAERRLKLGSESVHRMTIPNYSQVQSRLSLQIPIFGKMTPRQNLPKISLGTDYLGQDELILAHRKLSTFKSQASFRIPSKVSLSPQLRKSGYSCLTP